MPQIRIVYDAVRVVPRREYPSIENAIAEMPGVGWQRVGCLRRHRDGAQTLNLRSLDWRGERLAKMFIGEADPTACQICDLPIKPGKADAQWRMLHATCAKKAKKLIGERRVGGDPGSRGHWGVQAIRIVKPDSAEAALFEERRRERQPREMTEEQRDQANLLRSLAE